MTYALTHKTKQFFFLTIKLAIVIGAFYFLFHKLTHNRNLNFADFITIIDENAILSLKNLSILIVLSALNWFFEIKKWQSLVTHLIPISFNTATKQTLSAFTASVFTPNRIADYPAKLIYFKKKYRKRILLLNVLNNSAQMLATITLGSIGTLIFVIKNNINFNSFVRVRFLIVFLVISILSFLGVRQKKLKIRGFSIISIKNFIKNISTTTRYKVVFYAFIRYFLFSFQFYSLLIFFKINITFSDAMTGITTMYLIASIIPMLSFFDVVVKGSIAVYIFNFYAVNSIIVTAIIFIMWLLNTALPCIIGSYYIATFKLERTENYTL